jgi:hypothetical protein
MSIPECELDESEIIGAFEARLTVWKRKWVLEHTPTSVCNDVFAKITSIP